MLIIRRLESLLLTLTTCFLTLYENKDPVTQKHLDSQLNFKQQIFHFAAVCNGDGLTINELSLLLYDFVTQVSVLLEALHHKVFLPDDVVLEQRVGLHLRVLDLQLVDLAEEAQDLALLLRAHPPGQQLLQAPAPIAELQESALEQRLEDEREKERSMCARFVSYGSK